MLHGALFYSASPASGTAITALESADDSVRKFMDQDKAYLVGISAMGTDMSYVKIENDLWKKSQYLEVPPSGTVISGGTYWLPSPIPVIANSSWTVTPYGGGSIDDVVVILHLSYGPVYKNAPNNGIISREKDVSIGTGGAWVEIGTISDLDPSKKYIITGGIGVGAVGCTDMYAIRLKADSFKGMTPVYPATTINDAEGITQSQFIPEGMPVWGTQSITIEGIKKTTGETAYAFIFLAEE